MEIQRFAERTLNRHGIHFNTRIAGYCIFRIPPTLFQTRVARVACAFKHPHFEVNLSAALQRWKIWIRYLLVCTIIFTENSIKLQ